MTDPNFMVNFVKDCVSNGNNTTEAMISAAQSQIDEIDSQLKTMESLKTKKINLRSVLKQLGSTKKPAQEAADWDFSMRLKDMGLYRQMLLCHICDFINENPGCSASEVRDTVGSYGEQKQVYWGIKWLSARNIITHDLNRKLIKGSEWNKRPYETDKKPDSE